MRFLDRLFGRKEEPRAQPTYNAPGEEQQPPDADERALQRYHYMLKTAPLEAIEQAHEEAFAKLTPAQRARVLRELAAETPEGERATLARGQDEDPKGLARLATRAEMRRPGAMERIFGGMGTGGMGGAGTIFGSLVAGFVGSMIAEEFFHSMGDFGFGEGGPGTQPGDEQTDDSGYETNDASGGYGGDDPASGYPDGDTGGYGDDSGGDFGDWGGGDFGGDDW